MDEFLNTLLQLQDELLAMGVEPVKAIHIDRLTGMILYSRMQDRYRDMRLPMPAPVEMADDKVFMQFELAGMKFRYPAERRAMPDGSMRWE